MTKNKQTQLAVLWERSLSALDATHRGQARFTAMTPILPRGERLDRRQSSQPRSARYPHRRTALRGIARESGQSASSVIVASAVRLSITTSTSQYSTFSSTGVGSSAQLQPAMIPA